MNKKKNDKAKKEEMKGFDFEDISKTLANMSDKHHIKDIEFALTEKYLSHAKKIDEKTGVATYKDRFSREEAEKLLDDMVDEFNYHVHRRYMGISKDKWEELKKLKDPHGNPYVDTIAEYHGNLVRTNLKRQYAGRKKDNKITRQDLQEILAPAVRRHSGHVQTGIIKGKGIDQPEHIEALKGAIEKIKKKHHVTSEEYDTKQIYDFNEVLEKYVKLSAEYYSDQQ